MSIFRKSVTCSFVRSCTHILTKDKGKKFEDTFLVKIASKGTFLKTSQVDINLYKSEQKIGLLKKAQACS